MEKQRKLIRVLYLDDSRLDRQLVCDALRERNGGFSVEEVATPEELEQRLKAGSYDVILSDTGSALIDGLDIIEVAHGIAPRVPVIILTGMGSEEMAVQAMKRGASDYVTKTLQHIQRLPRAIREALDRSRSETSHRMESDAVIDREARFRALVENVRDLILVLSNEAVVRFVNRSVERVLGYPHGSLIDQPIVDLVHPEDEAAFKRAFQGALDTSNGAMNLPVRCRHRDGQWMVLEANMRRLTGDENSVVLGARDISLQRWAENALRESELQFRALIEQSVDAIFVQQDGFLVLVNKAWERMFGYSRAEALMPSFNVEDLVAPTSRALFASGSEVGGDQENVHLEFTGIRRNGEEIDIEVRLANILWKGRPARQGIYRDVTARKRAEEATRRYAERLEVLRGIDRALLGAQTPAMIAEVAAQHIQKLIDCAWACVLVTETDDPYGLTMAARAGTIEPRLTRNAYGLSDLSWTKAPSRTDIGVLTCEKGDREREGLFHAFGDENTHCILRVPLRMQDTFLGVLLLGAESENVFSSRHIDIAGEVAEQLSVAIHNRRLFDAVSAAHVRLERLSHRLVEVQEAERRHIALELHDEIGQVLTALNYTLDFTDSSLAETDREKVERARELVDMLTSKVRDLSLNLRPSMLDDLGLLPALIWFLDRYQKQTAIQVRFSPGEIQGLRFRSEVETTAYRVVQEALNNVARHADVKTVDVKIWTEGDELHLEVTDAGSGFDPKMVSQARPSAGLSGMQERAALVGGTINIAARPSEGVSVHVILPA